MRLLIDAIERFWYYSSEIFLQYFTDQTKKDYRDKKFTWNIAKCVLFFNKNIYKPYCFKWHHFKNFAEEIFAIDQFWQIFAIDQFWNFFAEEIFTNKGQKRKNFFRKNFFRKNFFRKRFLPLRYFNTCSCINSGSHSIQW